MFVSNFTHYSPDYELFITAIVEVKRTKKRKIEKSKNQIAFEGEREAKQSSTLLVKYTYVEKEEEKRMYITVRIKLFAHQTYARHN